jgi:hypothetical protein
MDGLPPTSIPLMGEKAVEILFTYFGSDPGVTVA